MRRSPADRIKAELRRIDVASCLEIIDRPAQVPGPLEGTFTLLLERKEPLGWTSLQRAPIGRNHDGSPGTNQELIRITVLHILHVFGTHDVRPPKCNNDLVRRDRALWEKEMCDHAIICVGRTEGYGLAGRVRRGVVGAIDAGLEFGRLILMVLRKDTVSFVVDRLRTAHLIRPEVQWRVTCGRSRLRASHTAQSQRDRS